MIVTEQAARKIVQCGTAKILTNQQILHEPKRTTNRLKSRAPVPVVRNVQIVKYSVSEASYETASEVQDAKDTIDDAITAFIASITEHQLPIQVYPFAPWASYLVDVECVINVTS